MLEGWLTEEQAIEWALRVGEHVRSDKQKRGVLYWATTLGLTREQTAQVLNYFEGETDE